MAMKDLGDLLEHMLQDIYYAEKQIVKELPKMAEKADSAELRQAFESHLEETKGHVENLERAFEHLDIAKKGEKCEAIEGILKEAKQIMDEIDDPDTMDAGMIAAAQAVEHYEITRYGTIISWAKKLGHDEVAKLMQATLDQEYAADQKLTKLAESTLNQQAA
jgi:ferritin-like metal-binding protein YciE